MRSLARLLAVIGAFGTEAIVGAQDEAQAQDWPRFHIGLAAGQSRLGPDTASVGMPEQPWGNRSLSSDTGKKVVLGFRPHRVVGVELQSVDFGEGDVAARAGRQLGGGQVTFYELQSYMRASSDADMLSALLFIPEPLVSLDFYAKVGVAHLDESYRAYANDYVSPGCEYRPAPYPSFCSFYTNRDGGDTYRSDSTPYVGIGVRMKVAPQVAVRVEYETIDREIGDNTTMLSLGFAWEPPSLIRSGSRP
jgi:hypothetical protein